MNDVVKEYRVKIMLDEMPESPRQWDNLGRMFYAHSKYILGDEEFNPSTSGFGSWDDYDECLDKRGVFWLPLYIYEHSGVTMRTSPFSCPWDSGRVGTIITTREDVLENFMVKRITKKTREMVYKVLRAEVEVFDMYLRGEVYGYAIEDEDGDQLDSCWGFYGEDSVNEAAQEALEGVM